MLLVVGPGLIKGSRMSHTARLTHPNDRPRHGHVVSTDVMVREMRRTDRRAAEATRDSRDTDQPTPEMVRERIRRTAVVPSALTVPCVVHGAAVSIPCYQGAVTAVCWQRVVARAGKR